MTEQRKQSLTDDQIIQRQKSSKLPSAGSPPIENYQYEAHGAEEVTEEVNEPLDPVTTLEAPRNLEIISQTIKFAPDGTQYATVVIEFDEVSAAEGYETRLAKV